MREEASSEVLTETLDLPSGNKYALLTLPQSIRSNRNRHLSDLRNGYLVTSLLPVSVPKHWREWVGSLLYQQIEAANFHLIVYSPSITPKILDEENQILQEKVYHFYTGLCISVPYFSHGEVISLTGSIHDTETDVRQFTRYPPTFHAPGSPHPIINSDRTKAAKEIGLAIADFKTTKRMERFPRILEAFHTAMQSPIYAVRLHQFVRCIEGFVLPQNQRKADDFARRVQEFIRGNYQSDLRQLYTIRSSIEHLRGPFGVIRASSYEERERILRYHTIQAETIARYCLRYFLAVPELWEYFSTYKKTQAYWNMPVANRERLWSGKLDLAGVARAMNR